MSRDREIVYVKPPKQPMWVAARKVAERRGISLSQLVNDAVETHLPKIAAEPSPTPPERWAEIAADAQTAA